MELKGGVGQRHNLERMQKSSQILDVAAGVLIHASRDEIAVFQRKAGGQAGYLWEFPGGKIETGETGPQALQRELQEELGLSLTVGSFLGESRWMSNHSQASSREVRLQVWLVMDFPDSGPKILTAHEAWRWISYRDFNDLAWAPADRPLLPAIAVFFDKRRQGGSAPL